MTTPPTPPLLAEDPKLVQGSSDKKRELDLREREVKAEEDEVAAKKKEQDRARWTNPLVLALFATTIGLIGNIWVEHANNKWAKSTEQLKAQSTLILEAIKTGDPGKACQNLSFFVRLGLVTDNGGTIQRECASSPQGPPSLPTTQQGIPADIVGVVLDADTGNPISGAIASSPGFFGMLATTDQFGRFVVPASYYAGDRMTISVVKEGYLPLQLGIVVGAAPYTVRLKKSK